MSSSDASLAAAFALAPRKELIAFTGGGGKSSLLFALAQELAAAGHRVVATTTTRISAAELQRAPAYFLAQDLQNTPETTPVSSDTMHASGNITCASDIDYANMSDARGYAALDASLETHRFCVVIGAAGPEKVEGVPLDLPARLLARPNVDYLLVEADGARRRPIKAPAEHEPAVPPQATLHIPVTGIDALSAPLEEIAHRPQQLAALLEISLRENLTPEQVARLLNSPQAALRNVPPQARVIPFINKVETSQQLQQARDIARLLLANPARDPRIQRVVIGALQSAQPMREILLA